MAKMKEFRFTITDVIYANFGIDMTDKTFPFDPTVTSTHFEFETKDRLFLDRNRHHFYGLMPTTLWQVGFGEYMEGGYSGNDKEPGYMMSQTEWFAEDDYKTAHEAFVLRMNSEHPGKSSLLGKPLNDLCEPDMSVIRENTRRMNEIRAAEKGFQLPVVEHMDPIPAHSNPFHYDSFNMGTDIPGGILVMHAGYQRPESPRPVQYLIIINQRTGQRVCVRFRQPTQYRYRGVPKHAGDWCIEGKDDLIGRDGVLEWCSSEADARAMFTTMREYPQFSTLVAREFEKDDTTIMAYTKD